MHLQLLFHLAIMAAPALSSTTTTINFDNYPTTPGGTVIPVDKDPSGMMFQAFVTIDVDSASTGIDPPSKRNYGGTSFRAQVMPDLKKKFTPTAESALFTVKYPGSTRSSFDMEQFYMSCVVAIPIGAVAVPVPCSVRLTALDANGNELAEKFAKFTPLRECPLDALAVACLALGPKEKMALIEFKGAFDRVVTVKIELDSSSAADKIVTAIGFDDMKVVFH